MANTTIKISQLPSTNEVTVNTLLPIVSTTGSYVTDKLTVGTLSNYILTEAGNILPSAFASDYAYSVINAAQPNITSVGTLTELSLNSVTALNIPGGVNGYVLQTDGLGNLDWTAMTGSGNGNPGGSNRQIQFNDSGLFSGVIGFTYDKDNDILSVGNINLAANLAGDYAVFTHDVTANVVTANYLYGDGSNITNVTVGATSIISNGTSNISIINDGNINFSAAGDSNIIVINNTIATFNVDLDVTANATFNNLEASSVNVSTAGNIYENGTALIIRTEPTHIFEIWGNDGATDYKWSFDQNGNLTLPGNTAFLRGDVNLFQLYNNNALQSGISLFENFEISATNNVRIFANNDSTPFLWEFDNTGNLILPGNTFNVNYANGNPVILGSAGIGNLAVIGTDIGIAAGATETVINISPTPEGWAFLQLPTNDVANVTNTRLTNDAGNVEIVTGDFSTGGSNTYSWIFDNTGNLTTPSSLKIQPIGVVPGTSITQTDAVLVAAAAGTTAQMNAGWAENPFAPGNVAFINFNNNPGNVDIVTGDNGATTYTWSFDNVGNAYIPGSIIGKTPNNNGSMNWVGDSSGDGFGYTTLNLIPDNTLIGNDQYVILDPTAPGHIHIRAGGTQDNSFASLFLGGENSYFQVPSGNDPSVYVAAGSNVWTFGNDGNLTTPGNIITTIVKTTPVAFASLPTATDAGAGARAFITDANVNTFGSLVGGGGIYYIPVFSNGVNWYVG